MIADEVDLIDTGGEIGSGFVLLKCNFVGEESQVDLTISHPMQMAWVVADILTAQGVQAVPIPTMDRDKDNAMDIMEVSQSQPELLVSFDHPTLDS